MQKIIDAMNDSFRDVASKVETHLIKERMHELQTSRYDTCIPKVCQHESVSCLVGAFLRDIGFTHRT